jgi:hypothetical protein
MHSAGTQPQPQRRAHLNDWIAAQGSAAVTPQQVAAYFEAAADAQRSHLSLDAVRLLVQSFVHSQQVAKALDLLGAHVFCGAKLSARPPRHKRTGLSCL